EERDREPLEQPDHLVAQLRLGRRDDQPTQRRTTLLENERVGDREERPMLAGRRELELEPLATLERRPVDRALRKLRQSRRLARERRQADVEQPVAARLLELLRREEGRRCAALLCPKRLVDVELRQPGGLATKLLARLVLRVVPEEPEGDEGRDETRQR